MNYPYYLSTKGIFYPAELKTISKHPDGLQSLYEAFTISWSDCTARVLEITLPDVSKCGGSLFEIANHLMANCPKVFPTTDMRPEIVTIGGFEGELVKVNMTFRPVEPQN